MSFRVSIARLFRWILEGGFVLKTTLFFYAAAVSLTLATSVFAQSATGTIVGRVVDGQGLPIPGVTVVAASPNLQGVRETVTSTNGDYILSLLPSGSFTVTFELSGFGDPDAHGCGRAHSGRPHRTDDESCGRLRDRRGRWPHRGRADRNSTGRHQLHAGPYLAASDATRHQRHVAAGARGPSDGAQRGLFNCRLDVFREPVFGEWRDREREPPRTGLRPLRGRRGSGNDGRDRWNFSGIRPFRWRRGERHYEIGWQHVQRLVPRHAE